MKLGPLAPMPWDMVVFLTITTVGFGYSVQRVVHPEKAQMAVLPLEEHGHPLSAEPGAPSNPTQTLDLGCLEDKRGARERVTAQEGAIRLKGELCKVSGGSMVHPEGITVRNVTTGSEGTIFFKGYSSAFVTDFLALATGRNLIQVEWRPSPREAPRIFTAEVFER